MVQTQSLKPSKPVLRSISTIDDNENTYNNVNFKRRRLNTPPVEEKEVKHEPLPQYNTSIDDDEDNEDDLDNIFNSDDDEYYSAISDYESDASTTKSRFIVSKPSTKKLSLEDELHSHMKTSLMAGDSLFDTDESESDAPISPICSISFGELKSLEENFQKIADENRVLTVTPVVQEEQEQHHTVSDMTLEDFLNYNHSIEEEQETLTSTHNTKQKFLQYRHDERHNLAFPDVSTFPIRYDPLVNTLQGMKTRVRALNRRAILSGKASEMVATGYTLGDFDMF